MLNRFKKALGKRLASKELVMAESNKGTLIIKKSPELTDVRKVLKDGVEIIEFPEHLVLPQGCAVIP